MNDTVWTRSSHWVGTPIQDSYVLLDVEQGEYLTLNGSATDIWTALDEPRPTSAVVDLLVAKYAVEPAECRTAVDGMLRDFAAKGLVSADA